MRCPDWRECAVVAIQSAGFEGWISAAPMSRRAVAAPTSAARIGGRAWRARCRYMLPARWMPATRYRERQCRWTVAAAQAIPASRGAGLRKRAAPRFSAGRDLIGVRYVRGTVASTVCAPCFLRTCIWRYLRGRRPAEDWPARLVAARRPAAAHRGGISDGAFRSRQSSSMICAAGPAAELGQQPAEPAGRARSPDLRPSPGRLPSLCVTAPWPPARLNRRG